MDFKYIQTYIVSISILIIVLFHIKKFENKFLLQDMQEMNLLLFLN